MKYVLFLAVVLLGTGWLLSEDASAQLATNKAFSLTGSGFAMLQTQISDASIDLLFVTTKTKTTSGFVLQSGMIVIDDVELNLSDLNGIILGNGKVFRITSTASDPTNDFTVRILGRFVEKTATESIYTISGTITDSNKAATKLFYTAKISEITTQTQTAGKTTTTIQILKGSANPGERTYKDQIAGFSFKYFSEDRITIHPGSTLIFVNEDTTSHSLKSGTANYVSKHKTFTPDDKISSGEILPGESWSVTFNEPGFYRLFDENYQWMDVTIFVIDELKRQSIKSNKPLN
jgi:plastocyanin